MLGPGELAAITDWLTRRGISFTGPVNAVLIAGGRSNLTYRLSDGTSHWVVRTPPRVGRTPSAHDIAREYRVVAALGPTDVPVAQAVALCEDQSVIGVPFSVTEFVPGLVIRSQSELDLLDDDAVDALTLRLVEVLAVLHRIDHIAIGLEDFGRPDAYAQRQLHRWSRQWDIVGIREHESLATELRTRLAASVPAQRSTAIVHGDYRLDNAIVQTAPATAARIAAVVDWELSTIGDPIADLAMMCAYREPIFDLIAGGPSAWTSPRLREPGALAAAYEASGGAPSDDLEYYIALANFKIAVIAAGIAHRFRAGAASGAGFDTAGEAVAAYLELGLQHLRGRS